MPGKVKQSYAHLLLDVVDSAYQGKAWHGPALRSTLKGVTVAEALFRPKAHIHNIWEIALHCAYWKYVVARRLMGTSCPRFPLRGTNWFPRSEEVSEQWGNEILILNQQHERLQKTILAAPAHRLSSPDIAHLVHGIGLHDAYHAGQIKLILRHQNSRKHQP